ncbi:MAG: HRDC domain-containing protein [Candidatus Delongbacteria bacterium]
MIKIFTVPVFESEQAVDELNKFLNSHRVIKIREEFNPNVSDGYWSFCVEYLQSGINKSKSNNVEKVDYKNILTEDQFKIFSRFRAIRKEIAKEEALPAYAIFTDKELADISKLNELSVSKLKSVEGIGEKKIERYGLKFIEMFKEKSGNEENGKSDK